MRNSKPAPSGNRRGFFQKVACIAGATLGGSALAADSKPGADPEVEKLKKKLSDAQFSHLPAMVAYLKRLQAKFGPGVLEEVKSVTIDGARESMEKSLLPKEKRNLDVVKKLYEGAADEIEYKWVEQSAELLKVRVTRCRWAEEFKKLNATDLGFAISCSYDYGYCKGLNPAMKFSRTKTLMQGDDHCNHTYELKS